MKQLKLTLALILVLLPSMLIAGNYRSFKVAIYVRYYEVAKMADSEYLESTWSSISSQMKVDRVYLETHRDTLIVPQKTLDKAKKFFKDRGIETCGGITYTLMEWNNFETYCYSNPEYRKKAQEVIEYTAKNFDRIILDDFFFTDCKCDLCIEAKGDMSWTEFRLKQMNEAGKNLIVGPAHKVNPKCEVLIKYPNWYDDFHGLGFNLEDGPKIFDGVWSGTETRDPAGAQHLQNYESYNIINYFQRISNGRNGGGWVDAGGINMSADRYAEQLWLTMFAKAPEIALFEWSSLATNTIKPEWKAPWQGTGTSFDWDEMMVPFKKGVTPTTMARIAGYTLEKTDKVVSQLGNPLGIKSYKCYHTQGDDFLQNYLGMIGLPMDMVSEFPTDQKVVLLTEQAKSDPDLVKKIDAQLHRGGDVVITSGLLEAIPDEIAQFAELTIDGKALVKDFGRHGKSDKDILINQIGYYTNDTWEIVSAGNPLTGGTSGWPILHRGKYSKGNIYVLTIPDDYSDLYHFPEGALNQIRTVLGRDLKARLEGPAKVSLFVYDNDKVIVESFLDEPVSVKVVVGDRKIPVLLKPHSYELIDIK